MALEFRRVERFIFITNFIVDIGSRTAPGIAKGGDLLSDHNPIAAFDIGTIQMTITCHHPMAMVNFDHSAIGPVAPGKGHTATGGGEDRLAAGASQIDPLVACPAAGKGVAAAAKRLAT